jgi:hypothetical protein
MWPKTWQGVVGHASSKMTIRQSSCDHTDTPQRLVFEELRRRAAGHTAILHAFDVIEHNGADPRDRRFLDRKAALALVLPIPRLALCSTNRLPRTCPLRPTPGLSGLDQGPQSGERRATTGAK